jgi:hypothetical protein
MEYIFDVTEEELYTLKSKIIVRTNLINKNPTLLEKIDRYSDLYSISFNEVVYLIKNNLSSQVLCSNCKKNTPAFISTRAGYKKYCSTTCSNNSLEVKNKKQEVCLEKWGVDNPAKSPEVKKKLSISSQNQTQESKEKRKRTCLSKWGYQCNLNIPEVKEKALNSIKKPETIEKRKKTCLDRIGYENPLLSPEVRKKIYKTNLSRWGYECPTKSEEIKQRSKKTCLEKWGVDNPSKAPEIIEKRKASFLQNLGVQNPFMLEEVREKSRKTSLERWGVEYPTQSQEVKDATRITNLAKYGAINNSASDIFRKENYNISRDHRYVKYLGDGFSLFLCPEGHFFELSSDIYSHRDKEYLCHVCDPKGISHQEIQLLDFVRGIYSGQILQSFRDGLEIDIYLPDLNLGFEFNGLYWHSELFKQKNYHLDKINYFQKKGTRIINIWEDDWNLRQEIVKSQIMNFLGLSTNKIGARKCHIIQLDSGDCNDFLSQNHILGAARMIVRLGLIYEGEIVSVMTFDNLEGRKKMDSGEWNLSRFANKRNTSVPGGASKLLDHFIKHWQPKRIISYADKDWSVGDLYYKLGFRKISDTLPDYKYVVNNKRVHKSNFKKSSLNTPLTEKEQMKKNGILRVYDSGKMKFEKVFHYG